jgi:hypothetical protein
MEIADGDANVMIAPLGPDCVVLHERAGWWCLSGGAVKRPVARYRYAGTLPFQQGYLLVPFRGTDPPFDAADGKAGPSGLITATVDGRHLQVDLSELTCEEPPSEPNVPVHIA